MIVRENENLNIKLSRGILQMKDGRRKGKKRVAFLMSVIMLCMFVIPLISELQQVLADTAAIRVSWYVHDEQQENNCGGYGYDYYQELARYTGWEYEYKIGTIQEYVKQILSGELDIISGIAKLPEYEDILLYSDYKMGSVRPVLYTRIDNEKLYFNDIEELQGITVGVVKNNMYMSSLEKYCETNNITMKLREYDSTDEMTAALKKGELDAAFSGCVVNISEIKLVAELEEVDLYFAMSADNLKLMTELNQALNQLEQDNPHFDDSLYNKYIYKERYANPSYTRAEVEYMRINPEIAISYDPAWIPVEYYDEAEQSVKGISADIIKKISEKTGLKFTYKKVDTFTQALEMIQNGSCDVIAAISNDSEWALQNNLYLSSVYLEAPVVLVVRNDFEGEEGKIAMPRNYYTTGEIEEIKGTEKIEYYDTVEECLMAVREGTADMTYINTYVANYYLSRPSYNGLKAVSLTGMSENISVAVSREANPLLYSIINKTLLGLSSEEINNIVVNNMFSGQENITLKDYIYLHPVESAMAIGTVCIVIVGALLAFAIFVSYKNKRIDNAMTKLNVNQERFKLALHQILCDIFEYDFENKTLIRIDNLTGEPILLIENLDYCEEKNVDSGDGVTVYGNLIEVIRRIAENISEYENEIEDIIQGSRDGKRVWARFTASIVYKGTNPATMIGTLEDITEEVSAEMDSLTGLYNRAALRKQIEKCETGGCFAMIDVDNFKGVNDTYGHSIGDKILQYVAGTLKVIYPETAVISRMGGDEFAVYIAGAESDETIITSTERLYEHLKANPYKLSGGRELSVHLSIGIASSEESGNEFEALYNSADKALYVSKEKGKNTFSFLRVYKI